MAKRIQVFAILPGNDRRYVTGADSANNWHEDSQPIPVNTKALEFVFIDKGTVRVIEFPVLIPPAHIKNGTVEITLTANHFENAREATYLRHHRRVEKADGTFVEIIQADPRDWTRLTPEQKALLGTKK